MGITLSLPPSLSLPLSPPSPQWLESPPTCRVTTSSTGVCVSLRTEVSKAFASTELRVTVLYPLLPPSGLDEEGLYRKPGILSKATKLLKDCVEKGRLDKIDFSDEFEWDTKTVASAVKFYFNKHLGEPLLTFALHSQFVDSASEYCV